MVYYAVHKLTVHFKVFLHTIWIEDFLHKRETSSSISSLSLVLRNITYCRLIFKRIYNKKELPKNKNSPIAQLKALVEVQQVELFSAVIENVKCHSIRWWHLKTTMTFSCINELTTTVETQIILQFEKIRPVT